MKNFGSGLTGILIVALLMACNGEKQELTERIASIEKTIYKDSIKTLNKEEALKASDLYGEYVTKFPKDERAPEMLFKAATINNSLFLFEQAVHLYKQLYTEYPEHKKAAVSLFLSAFISENYLHNLDRAKADYTEFLAKFPKHELTKDVMFSIAHLGKSDEELIREFEKDSTGKPAAIQ